MQKKIYGTFKAPSIKLIAIVFLIILTISIYSYNELSSILLRLSNICCFSAIISLIITLLSKNNKAIYIKLSILFFIFSIFLYCLSISLIWLIIMRDNYLWKKTPISPTPVNNVVHVVATSILSPRCHHITAVIIFVNTYKMIINVRFIKIVPISATVNIYTILFSLTWVLLIFIIY